MLEYGQSLRDKVLVCIYKHFESNSEMLGIGTVIELLGCEKNEANAGSVDKALKHLRDRGYLEVIASNALSSNVDIAAVTRMTGPGEEASEKLIAEGADGS